MPLLKTITVDGFYTPEQAKQMAATVYNLKYTDHEFGKYIENFNLCPPDADQLFSTALNFPVTVDQETGNFRIPQAFIHFEDFSSQNDWLFVVALQNSTFNIFEHKTGVVNALEGHKFNYRNLFEWDLTVSYLLQPGQGILFRPWLFHSFDSGLIQSFRLAAKE